MTLLGKLFIFSSPPTKWAGGSKTIFKIIGDSALGMILELIIAQKSSWMVLQHNTNKFEKTQNFDFFHFFLQILSSNQELDLGSDPDFGRVLERK